MAWDNPRQACEAVANFNVCFHDRLSEKTFQREDFIRALLIAYHRGQSDLRMQLREEWEKSGKLTL